MRALRLAATLSCCVALFALLNSPVGDLPPLGRFLNPFAGFWTNNRTQDALPTSLDLPGLTENVEILWDQRRIPHVFAENDHDLYMAQGYVVARERLWQMDFQARAAAGRLSEIFGSKALEHDRFRRRIGLGKAAEKSLEQILEDPQTRLAAEAFSAGVNAWIDQLSPAILPLEYKILDYEPERWSPLKSALLLKSLTYTLTFRHSELSMTRTAELLGPDLMDRLYPESIPSTVPAVPAGADWSFIRRPKESHAVAPRVSGTPTGFRREAAEESTETEGPALGGSNAWAVSGSKTASGYPILCSDPHLALTLPSIWYELQLSAPGINVYGVTIPGAPGVLIGFNSGVAWGMTNAGSDVLDWYVLTFRDSTRQEYRYGSSWQPTKRRVEAITVRSEATVIDTVLETHYGPIVFSGNETSGNPNVPVDAALRWTAHDASNELLSILQINAAASGGEFVGALRHFDAPAQNFVYADRGGAVGIVHAGKFPVRRNGQGRFLRDGADPGEDWTDWIPRDYLPQAVNPEDGFVCSANQPPVDKRYPYYLGSEYASSDRAMRIHDVLQRLNEITPEMMISLQNDAFSVQAHALLPLMLPVVKRCQLTDEDLSLLRELEGWDCEYRRELYAPTIFEEWWVELNAQIWRDDLQRDGVMLRWPRRDVTTAMILDGSIRRFADNRNTDKRERWEDVVCSSFQNAMTSLWDRLGPLDEQWQWGNFRRTTIAHLARIPGLGSQSLKTSGHANVVNATTASAGPSWRMIVALGDEPKAWGIYPGGQSGNPGSDAYDNAVSDWARGFTYELVYLRSPRDSLSSTMHSTQLRRSP